jgi:hypothetical protein
LLKLYLIFFIQHSYDCPAGGPDYGQVVQVSPLTGPECGEGRRYRRLDCFHTQGHLVDIRYRHSSSPFLLVRGGEKVEGESGKVKAQGDEGKMKVQE